MCRDKNESLDMRKYFNTRSDNYFNEPTTKSLNGSLNLENPDNEISIKNEQEQSFSGSNENLSKE